MQKPLVPCSNTGAKMKKTKPSKTPLKIIRKIKDAEKRYFKTIELLKPYEQKKDSQKVFTAEEWKFTSQD